MAKGLGIIGNFKGKVGNIVGYNLKDSNNKQTQGLRAYQPVVRNPKTARQAEQRTKMAPINATYRALKGIIDRGQEGVAYGNKSRLRFLSEAMKQFDGPWFEKGDAVTLPIKTNITRGSLQPIIIEETTEDGLSTVLSVGAVEQIATVGALSTALLANNSFLKEGDQLTFVHGKIGQIVVVSVILDSTSTVATTNFIGNGGTLDFNPGHNIEAGLVFGAAILSREGDNGQHLRSTTALLLGGTTEDDQHYTSAAKDAAIESYMAANGNTDWPQEQI
ncbi:hypothetical protein ACQUWZ_23780 [Ralstonia pseudosolanacearum]|uniref:hypothetical protein n=1 Tax=Ralstonia pseudosolanacearum TaxID=1310165 RepID=UPI003D180B56